MMRAAAEDRDFLLYYARVLLREAKARRGQNVAWLIAGAQRARRDAMSIRPAQADLFASGRSEAGAVHHGRPDMFTSFHAEQHA